MNEPAKDPFSDHIASRLWLLFSNVCDKGKFKVTLEVDGIEIQMFNSYVEQGEVVVSESHNLTPWLTKSYNKGKIDALEELAKFCDGSKGYIGMGYYDEISEFVRWYAEEKMAKE